jgi:hypothetical protein
VAHVESLALTPSIEPLGASMLSSFPQALLGRSSAGSRRCRELPEPTP